MPKCIILLLFSFQARAYHATDVAACPPMPAKLKIVRGLKPWRCAHPMKHVSSSKDCTKKDQVCISTKMIYIKLHTHAVNVNIASFNVVHATYEL